MSMRPGSPDRLWGRLFRGPPQAEVDEEFQHHLEERVRDYVARGMAPERARAAALERFGNLEAARSECERLLAEERRAEDRRDQLDDLRQDVRFGVRAALRAPLFSLLAVLTLALGIGANAAVFGVLKSVLLDSLPYSDSDRLVRIYTQFENAPTERSSVSPGAATDLAERLRSFSSMSFFNFSAQDITYNAESGPRVLSGAAVQGNLFSTLGVRAALGRTLTEADGNQSTLLLTHAGWTRQFGGDPDVVGRTVLLNKNPYELVGVLPREFVGPMGEADVYMAMDLTALL
ncbi:MAG: ABC transporter permease, partial [Gemmatimonadetes bacterium]|nr:ABC transporter permease [Gemmatimonadota bacterium]